MDFDGFKKWINLHHNFVKSFDRCFRPELWQINTKRNLLGFHDLKSNLEGEVLIGSNNSSFKKKANLKLFGMFLMVFKSEFDEMPFRVVILKGLDFEFQINEMRIIMSHEYSRYRSLKIQFKSQKDFEIWKDYITTNAKDVFFKRYMIIEKIGRGRYSNIHKVISHVNGKFYALKIIKKKGLSQTEMVVLENEAKIMEVLNHKNIIKFYEESQNFESILYIIEYVQGHDLFEYITDNFPIGETKSSWIMKNLFEAIDYIHSCGIVHRDLKPENIMLETDSKTKRITKIKIIDFGLSCYLDDLKKNKEDLIRCGTVNYTAPEVFNSDSKYDQRSDTFSLGVIMFYLLKGSLPFIHNDSKVIREKIMKGNFNLDETEDISVEAQDLIKKLLVSEMEKRISLKDAMNHPWITNKNFFLDRQSFKKSRNFKK